MTGVVVVVIIAAITALAALAWLGPRRRRKGEARSDAAEAQRLRLALDAGEMGTWSWDRTTGRVTWDARLETLFGLDQGAFAGTFDAWAELLHPDDRDRILRAVDDATQRHVPFRFDHRVIHTDGSVHWVEGRGEPIVASDGTVLGATGVTINIDERRNTEVERAQLLERERAARAAVEHASDALRRLTELTLALSGSTTVAEVAAAAVRHGTSALRARYGWFGVVNAKANEIVTLAHEGYPPEFIDPYLVISLDDPLPAAEALRTGEPIFIESPDDRRARYPQFLETGVHGAFVVVPIVHAEDSRGVLAFGYPDPRTFAPQDRHYIAAVIEACTQALQRAALFESAQGSRQRLRTLLDLSEALAAIDEPDEVLATAGRVAADRVGRFATVYSVENDGLRRVVALHTDPALTPLLDEVAAHGVDGRALAQRAVDSGEIIVERIDDDAFRSRAEDVQQMLSVLHPTSVLVVPMRISGRTRGALVIGTDTHLGFGASDAELAADIGRRTASAHERAQLWQASQQRFEVEHQMVEVLQQSIVPDALPDLAATELAAVYRPAGVRVDVGGDWYDAFERDGAIVLVVGDVAGHGVEAATLMSRVRNALRAYAAEDDDPGRMLERTDGLLHAFEEDAMVTAVVVRYEPATGDVQWARAGHLPPLLCDGGGGIRFLDDVNAPPLGTMAEHFETARARLGPGSLLVLYTDGLVERRDCVLDDGLAWLAKRVRELHREQLDDVCASLADDPFVPLPSGDDICVLAVRAAKQ